MLKQNDERIKKEHKNMTGNKNQKKITKRAITRLFAYAAASNNCVTMIKCS